MSDTLRSMLFSLIVRRVSRHCYQRKVLANFRVVTSTDHLATFTSHHGTIHLSLLPLPLTPQPPPSASDRAGRDALRASRW